MHVEETDVLASHVCNIAYPLKSYDHPARSPFVRQRVRYMSHIHDVTCPVKRRSTLWPCVTEAAVKGMSVLCASYTQYTHSFQPQAGKQSPNTHKRWQRKGD